MGEIIGAGVVSHVPTIVMPEDDRKRLNNGQDLSLVEGLERLRSERLDKLNPETVVVIDTHWFTTVEHIITAHDRRKGIFTSDELPLDAERREVLDDLGSVVRVHLESGVDVCNLSSKTNVLDSVLQSLLL